MICGGVPGRRLRRCRSARGHGTSSLARASRAPCPPHARLRASRARSARVRSSTTTDSLTAASTADTPGVGITAAAGTELALRSRRAHGSAVRPSPRLVTASPAEWAISAPAAVHGRGRRLSGALSGCGPRPPVPVAALGVRYTANKLVGPRLIPAAWPQFPAGARRGGRCRGSTEPSAAGACMHGLGSEASVCVRQNRPGARVRGSLPGAASRPPPARGARDARRGRLRPRGSTADGARRRARGGGARARAGEWVSVGRSGLVWVSVGSGRLGSRGRRASPSPAAHPRHHHPPHAPPTPPTHTLRRARARQRPPEGLAEARPAQRRAPRRLRGRRARVPVPA